MYLQIFLAISSLASINSKYSYLFTIFQALVYAKIDITFAYETYWLSTLKIVILRFPK